MESEPAGPQGLTASSRRAGGQLRLHCPRTSLSTHTRALELLAGDPVLVPVEPPVEAIEPAAAPEVGDRIAALGVITCAVPADAVRVHAVERGAVPVQGRHRCAGDDRAAGLGRGQRRRMTAAVVAPATTTQRRKGSPLSLGVPRGATRSRGYGRGGAPITRKRPAFHPRTELVSAGSTGRRRTERVDRPFGIRSEHRPCDRDHRGSRAARRRVGREAEALAAASA